MEHLMPATFLSQHVARLSRSRPALLRLALAVLRLRHERRALARLDDHLLADIGLTPDAARLEVERPLWDVPAHWQRPDRDQR